MVEQVRKSKAMICVLRDRYGSGVFNSTELVSFLQAEIYQAAVFHNNVHLFLMEPFNPDQRLKDLLDLVNVVRPGLVPAKAIPELEVIDRIKRVLDDERHSQRKPWTVSVRALVGTLAAARGYPRPDLEFLGGEFRSVYTSKVARPNKDHIGDLLGELPKHEAMEPRLTRMWIALRELSAAPYDDPSSAEYMPLWEQALGAWKALRLGTGFMATFMRAA